MAVVRVVQVHASFGYAPFVTANPHKFLHVTVQASSSYYHPDHTDVQANARAGRGDASVYQYDSFRVSLLLLDTTEQERRGLSFRKLTKLTQPWVTENPLFFHLSDTSPIGVRKAVDDAAEVGIEMIVQSFGTSFKMENGSPVYMADLKAEIAYAASKNIEIGGYDLIDLDRSGAFFFSGRIYPLEDAIGCHAYSLEAHACV
jgi:hypothetical protein